MQAALLCIKGVVYVLKQLGSGTGLPPGHKARLHDKVYKSLGKSLWWAKEDDVDLL